MAHKHPSLHMSFPQVAVPRAEDRFIVMHSWQIDRLRPENVDVLQDKHHALTDKLCGSRIKSWTRRLARHNMLVSH